MKKVLKKCYRTLDLPFNSTIEDVELRKKAILKTLEIEHNSKKTKQKIYIENSANIIIENIKNNGVPNEEDHYFESSNESIFALVIVLIFVSLLCYFSINILKL